MLQGTVRYEVYSGVLLWYHLLSKVRCHATVPSASEKSACSASLNAVYSIATSSICAASLIHSRWCHSAVRTLHGDERHLRQHSVGATRPIEGNDIGTRLSASRAKRA